MYNKSMGISIRHLLLVCALVVAIPFQGVASTLMFACEMSHGMVPLVSEQTTQMSSDTHGAHVSADYGLDEHHSYSSDSHKNHLKYNSCGSSSASGAVNSTAVFVAPVLGHSFELVYVSSRYLPPTLAGLDRPPRLLQV